MWQTPNPGELAPRGGGGGWGGLLYKKDGVLVRNLKKKKAPRSCFVGVAGNVFSPRRYQCLLNISSPVIFSQLNTLKGTAKAHAVHLLRLNTLRDTKTALSSPISLFVKSTQ